MTDQLGVDRSRSTSWRGHQLEGAPRDYCTAHGGHGSHKQPILGIAFSLDTVAQVADTQSRGIMSIEDTRKPSVWWVLGPCIHVG